jgi:hypothetical protein
MAFHFYIPVGFFGDPKIFEKPAAKRRARTIPAAPINWLPTVLNRLRRFNLFRQWNAPFHYRVHTEQGGAQ